MENNSIRKWNILADNKGKKQVRDKDEGGIYRCLTTKNEDDVWTRVFRVTLLLVYKISYVKSLRVIRKIRQKLFDIDKKIIPINLNFIFQWFVFLPQCILQFYFLENVSHVKCAYSFLLLLVHYLLWFQSKEKISLQLKPTFRIWIKIKPFRILFLYIINIARVIYSFINKY